MKTVSTVSGSGSLPQPNTSLQCDFLEVLFIVVYLFGEVVIHVSMYCSDHIIYSQQYSYVRLPQLESQPVGLL